MWQNRSLITLLFAVVLQQCFDLLAASRPGSDLPGSAEPSAEASVSTEEPDSAHGPLASTSGSSEEPSHDASAPHGNSKSLEQSLDHFANDGNSSGDSEPSHDASVPHGTSESLEQSLDHFANDGNSSVGSEPSPQASVPHGTSESLEQDLDNLALHGNGSGGSEPHENSSGGLVRKNGGVSWTTPTDNLSSPSHDALAPHGNSDPLEQDALASHGDSDALASHGNSSSGVLAINSGGALTPHGNSSDRSAVASVAPSKPTGWSRLSSSLGFASRAKKGSTSNGGSEPSHDASGPHGSSSGGLDKESGAPSKPGYFSRLRSSMSFTSKAKKGSGEPATTSGGLGRGWRTAQTNLKQIGEMAKFAAAPQWVQDVATGKVDKAVEEMEAEGPMGPAPPFNEISEEQQKTYEDAIGSAAKHKFPTDAKLASEMGKFKGEEGKKVLGKRIGMIDKMLEGLVPAISKARMLAGGGRVIGVEQNLAQFQKRGQTLVGDMKGSKKLAETILTHFKDATEAARSMDNFKERANAATIKTLRDEANSMMFPEELPGA